MIVDAYYDNSRANRHNPNPSGRCIWADDVGRDDGAVLRRAHRLEHRSDERAQARALPGVGRRCVRGSPASRRAWLCTAMVSAQGGGKPATGNPTPGTAQPDPPNVADRGDHRGLSATGGSSSGGVPARGPNTPSNSRFELANAEPIERVPPGTGGSTALRPWRVEQDLSSRRHRQSVLAIRRRRRSRSRARSSRQQARKPPPTLLVEFVQRLAAKCS